MGRGGGGKKNTLSPSPSPPPPFEAYTHAKKCNNTTPSNAVNFSLYWVERSDNWKLRLLSQSTNLGELSVILFTYCLTLGLFIVVNVTMNTPLILLYAVKVILTLCEKQLFTKLLELLRLLLNLYLSLEKETQNIINGARKPKRTFGSWKTPSEKLLHGKLPLIKNIFTVFGFISRSLNFPHKCCAKKKKLINFAHSLAQKTTLVGVVGRRSPL